MLKIKKRKKSQILKMAFCFVLFCWIVRVNSFDLGWKQNKSLTEFACNFHFYLYLNFIIFNKVKNNLSFTREMTKEGKNSWMFGCLSYVNV